MQAPASSVHQRFSQKPSVPYIGASLRFYSSARISDRAGGSKQLLRQPFFTLHRIDLKRGSGLIAMSFAIAKATAVPIPSNPQLRSMRLSNHTERDLLVMESKPKAVKANPVGCR